ncbi:ParB family chromosome partitioning protein [Cryobacterium sp. MP_3.1]|uniref:ParB/RepB/Spo0J family partition protein n=1 Tax=Cryobacterium sp. MP_3.1 TaxID=3071711 RepID=UPI002DF8F5B2|nr:ParB family chromosome partitioning protein [Cryobacterium sp. MP_3.1]
MTNTPGHIELERSIDSIRIGSRHRTDLGDIDLLAASIERQGLLQPITVTPDGTLVCGARRLAALRQLGVRKLNVWVRSGISEQLTRLLAEQDENALHKALNPTEAATLYREVKILLAEDASRRQEASRFGSEKENPRSDGAATVAAPLTTLSGDARAQAALFVTGRRSYTTLERIGDLQRIAADQSVDEELRSRAGAELALIQDGGSVSASHHRMKTQVAVLELERLAMDPAQPAGIREASSMGATRVQTAAPMTADADLERLAQDALARAKTATKSKKTRSPATADAKLPVRSFVFLWHDLGGWWLRYDVEVISAQLTDGQLAQFEETLAGTIAFAEQLRRMRDVSLDQVSSRQADDPAQEALRHLDLRV